MGFRGRGPEVRPGGSGIHGTGKAIRAQFVQDVSGNVYSSFASSPDPVKIDEIEKFRKDSDCHP